MARRDRQDRELDRLAREAAHQTGLSRRGFMAGMAGFGLAIGAGGLLTACSKDNGTGSTGASAVPTAGVTALPGGTPVKGGTFTVGVLTLGSAENLFPGTAVPNPDVARDFALYNLLFYPTAGNDLYPLVPGLAMSAEPNSDATMWTLKLRDGVVWHDGKPFTANDVVYNITQL